MSTEAMILKIKYNILEWAINDVNRIISNLGEPISIVYNNNYYTLHYLEGYIMLFDFKFGYGLRYSGHADELTDDLLSIIGRICRLRK